MTRIAFTGGRTFNYKELVEDCFDKLCNETVDSCIHIVVGDAQGLDAIVRKLAFERGFPLEVYRANWREHGKSAGPRRNREMLDSGVDCLYAFKGGLGTDNCIREAIKRNIRVVAVVWPLILDDSDLKSISYACETCIHEHDGMYVYPCNECLLSKRWSMYGDSIEYDKFTTLEGFLHEGKKERI